MPRFEYEITRYPAETLRELLFFCNEEGQCQLEQVPHEQLERLTGLLNERGWQGWELVEIAFGADGLLAFWKRQRPADPS
ncbi:MAG: hypothetical protein AB1634_10250 [Thermodesulfobacteriota bacterium]